ncbi:MAG: hypothetical protein QMC67_15040 [Candidatus Wallbacteria bacterium]
MSKETVKKMFAAISKNSEMHQNYMNMVQKLQKENQNLVMENLIKFGSTNGFNFSKDDLTEARQELIDKINSNSELDEKDLSNVSGGTNKGSFIAASVVSAGIYCAITSIAGALTSTDCTEINITSQSYHGPK